MTTAFGTAAYLGATVALTAAMPVVPDGARKLIFLAVSLLAAVPVARLLRRVPRHDRPPFLLLALGTGWLLANNVFSLATGESMTAAGDVLVAIGSAHMLGAAVALVLRRGRNDVGGLLDAAVVAVVVAALLWTTLLQPRLDEAGVPLARQAGLLATVLLISGVLGTLIRVLRTADRRPAPLVLFTLAIGVDLVGTVVVTTATGSISTPSSASREVFLLAGWVLLGLAARHPGAAELARPGPVPPDRLFAGRVIVLSAAAAVVPLVSGIREILGIRGDAALLTVGNLVIVALIGFRVARIGRQREEAARQLRHQATHDLLTGLPNRAALWNRLDAALRRERAAGHPSVVLLFCDLNGFKQVNDRLGHLAGDRLLTEVGARLGGLGVFAARYGGDEFVLVGEDADAGRLTGLIEEALAEPVIIAGEPVRVGASVGAVHSDARSGADELIRRADQAMYQHKAARLAA